MKTITYLIISGALLFLSACNINRVKSNAEDKRCGISAGECDLCSETDPRSPKFVVAVVGDGVSEDSPGEAMWREYPVNRAQGEAMWNGVRLALNHSAPVSQVKEYITVKAFDDGGSAECAKKIAECLYHNACVLAVIGHATSGTTTEAAEYYYRARIPLIMPIATSPRVFYPVGKNEPRYDNLFRLPPGDDQYQAYALGYYAIEKLQANKIYLFGDVSPDAELYSRPIFEKLDREVLGNRKLYADEVSRANASNTAALIRQSNPDLVIFAGYWSNFDLILGSLSDLYKKEEKKPKILLSDGCLSKDSNSRGFDVFITFPSPDVQDTSLTQTADLSHLRGLISQQNHQSYEIYGYDALHVTAQAILESRREGISRTSLLQALGSGRGFQGAGFPYRFERGENIQSNYYVFDVNKNKFEIISAKDINGFKSRNGKGQ